MKTEKIKIILMYVNILLSIAVSVLGYFILPDTLVMQITMNGKSGTVMPKILGLILPLAINIVFSVSFIMKKDNKYIYLSLVSYLIYGFTFVVNL